MLEPLQFEKSSVIHSLIQAAHWKSLQSQLGFRCRISGAPSCLCLILHSNVQDQINGPNTSAVISSWIVCKIACRAYIHHNIVPCTQFMCTTLQSKMTTKSLFVHWVWVCLLRISTHRTAQMIAYLLICSLDPLWLLISIFIFFLNRCWYTMYILSLALNKFMPYSFGNITFLNVYDQ